MKLTARIVGIFLLGIVLVTVVHGYFTVRRQQESLQAAMEEEARSLARALEQSVLVLWSQGGRDNLLEWVQGADQIHERISIRWLDLEDPQSTTTATLAQLRRSPVGTVVSTIRRDPAGRDMLHMYYPIHVSERFIGCLEFVEPLSEVTQYTRVTIYQTLGVIAAMAVCAALVTSAGIQWVGQPLEKLIAKTKRIGKGDFSDPLELEGLSELSELATAINQMSDQLQDSQQRLEAESAAKLEAIGQLRHLDRLQTVGRLASGVAHELGTPLNVISGRAELIQSGQLPSEELAKSAAVIQTESQRMAAIIRQLLDFARRGKPQRSDCDLGEVVQHAVGLLSSYVEKQQVELNCAVRKPIRVHVDPAQIQQVVTNLIVNAVQSMKQGGTVDISVGRETAARADELACPRDCAYIRVQDQGTGIHLEDQDHVFEPFFTTKDIGEGTGLGLSVSYGIVQDHDGWIDLESTPGLGSCFIVRLPLTNSKEQS